MKKSRLAWQRWDLVDSLVLIAPLYLAYAIGILFAHRINGVDFVSRHVWALCGADRGHYLLVHAVIALGFVWWVRRTGRARTLAGDVMLPLVLEAAIYAVAMAAVITLLMQHVLVPIGVLSTGGWDLHLGAAGERLVASIGAGVHEELVFRLGLCGGGTWLLVRIGASPRLAIGLAVVASSLLFAWAHHVGPYGDPWSADVFAYRALAGGVFALVYGYRSLAHAVYAHALYDVWVLILRPML